VSRGIWALGRGRLYVIVPEWIAKPVLRWVPGATGGYTNQPEWGGERRFLPFIRVYGNWRSTRQSTPDLPTKEGVSNGND